MQSDGLMLVGRAEVAAQARSRLLSSDVISLVHEAVSGVTNLEWVSEDVPLMDAGMDSFSAIEFR